LARWNSIALVVAVVAPLLSIAALIVDRVSNSNLVHLNVELATFFCCAACLIGLMPAFWSHQLMQADLKTFSRIVATYERPDRGQPARRSGSHIIPSAIRRR
jgi:hypothetical protein